LLPWEVVSSLKLEDAVKYHSELDPKSPRLYSAIYVFAMNAATYKSLPDDLKKVINANSGPELSEALGKIFDESATGARKLAVERGHAVNVLSVEEVTKSKSAAQGVVDEWIKEVDQRGVSGKELIESAREAIAEYDRPK
jgi:TRAP-type C4-dicarboxylate transport system substrate-binding protein